MDFPNLLHHHPQHQKLRYVSVPNSSRSHYPDDVDFHNPRYQHRHHHIPRLQPLPPSPPPPPPPPQTPSFQPQPPPPPQLSSVAHHPPQMRPYSPGQSQFACANPNHDRTSFEDDFHRSSYLHRDFVVPANVSRQLPLEDDRPRHRLPEFEPEIRQELWEQPRILAENLPERSHTPLNFGRGSQKFQLDRKPMSSYNMNSKLRHPSEGISRLRAEFVDGFESKHRDELSRGAEEDNYSRRGSFLSNPGTSFRDTGFASNPSLSVRDMDSDLESYNPRYGSSYSTDLYRSGSRREGVYHDNQRRVHDRKFSRESHNSSFERGNSEVSNGDGAHIGSVKREYFGPELGRYSSWGSREDAHEYNHTPRKQLQKKSALLRLQKGKTNHRNVESEQVHYAGHHDNSNSSSFRRKDHHVYGEGEREGSPVELDVSFKSNSLVAKAIVAPSSLSDSTGADLTSRDRKFRKDSLSVKGCSNPKPNKLGDNTANVDVSMHVGNDKPSHEKETTQSEGVVSSGVKNTSTQAHSSVTDQSVKKTEVIKFSECAEINNKDDIKVGSDNVSVKVAKKKKVVRKIIKKVVRPRPLVSSQQKRKRDELVKADVGLSTPSETSGNHKGVSLSCPCPNEVKMVHEEKKVEGFAAAIESVEHGINVNASRTCDKIGNSLGAFSVPSSSEEIMIDKGPEFSVQGLPTISNSNEALVRSLGVSTNAIPEIAHAVNTKESHPSGDSLLFDGALEKDSIPVLLPVGGNGDSAVLNPGEIKMHNNLMTTYCCNSRTLDIVSGLTLSKEESRVCHVGTNDVLRKLPSGIQVTALHDNIVQKEVSNAAWSAESCIEVGSSGLGKTTMNLDNSLHIEKTTSMGDNFRNCEKKTAISSSCTVDHMQPYRDDAAELYENGAMKNFSNTKISFGNNKGDKPLTSRKRTVRSQLDFSNTTDPALDAVNVSNPTTAVDTMLSFSADHQNNVVVSCMGNMDVALPPGEDQAIVLHQNSSSVGQFDSNLIARDNVKNDFHFSPPHYRKKRKVLDSHLAMPSRSTSEADELPSSTSCAESLTSNEISMQQNKDLNRSIVDTSSSATNLMHCEHGITELSEGSDTMVAVRSFFDDDMLKSENQPAYGLILENPLIPTVESLCPEGSKREQRNVDAAVMVVEDQYAEAFNVESGGEELLGVSASREQVIAQEEAYCTIPSDVRALDIDQRFSFTGMESDNLLMKDESPSSSNSPSLSVDQSGVSTVTSSDEAMEFVPDALRTIGSQQSSFTASNVHISGATFGSQISNETCSEDRKLVKKFVDTDGSILTTEKSLLQCTDANLKSDCATERDQAIEEKSISLPSQDSRSFLKGVNINSADHYNGQKNQLGRATPRTFLGRTSFGFTSIKKKATSNHSNPRTWHRNSISLVSPPGSKPLSKTDPSQSQLSDRDGKIQSTSYVRKGNSLVRKPSPAAALPQRSPGFIPIHRLNSPGLDESKSSIERVGAGMSNGILRKGETKASCEKSRTSLVHSGTKLPNVPMSSRGCTSSPSAGPHLNGCFETISDPTSSTENIDQTKFVKDSLTSENQNGLLTSLDNQSELDDGNLASVNPKKIVYVKRKSNQLVATSKSTDFSVPNFDKMQASSFDGYFKRRKNQLIRTSLESHTKQPIVMPNDNLSMDVQVTLKAISSRRLNKRRSQKVVAKTFKRSSNSLVWTLCNSHPSNNDSGTISHQKVYPHLFPWKRTTYWRNFTQNWNSISKSNSLAISGKLLLSRKRDTVYTRSINGFSLRKSKVLSVGGSSLKWSKSIERHSKKANEEATLAVAAVEKKKREQKGSSRNSSGSKDRNHTSRERIFRVGSCRYKMDPSRRTLQRISDDESSFAATTHPYKDAKRSYIPRRLVIGNNEYVRIGNGNQLVRDPKKRTRILASEKVRWSLHTARIRLAKKRKYCQFFTRFGKCNKDNGRCHFIHDPSKIAVCTKFLNGLCSNANCKLTHKVIPERMPDCSYFLQGLCTNKHCPYRHVNVNPKATTCEGFLRGYCADGNECRKKHSYICPSFEATGTCPQESKCKLHHPKNRTQEKKRTRSKEVRNDRGRYFRSPDPQVSEPKKEGFEKNFAQDYSNIIANEDLTDFIAIDATDDDAGESNDPSSEKTTFCVSNTSDLQLDDFEELLIKPFRLIDSTPTSSATVLGSSSVNTLV